MSVSNEIDTTVCRHKAELVGFQSKVVLAVRAVLAVLSEQLALQHSSASRIQFSFPVKETKTKTMQSSWPVPQSYRMVFTIPFIQITPAAAACPSGAASVSSL